MDEDVKIDNEVNSEKRREDVKSDTRAVCPACGQTIGRERARFCQTCGRSLSDDGYRPADAVRASYHLHRRKSSASQPAKKSPERKNRTPQNRRSSSAVRSSPSALFLTTRNSAAATALAFLTFSLVPYLGILFCPGAVVMGIAGLWTFARTPELGGRAPSLFSIAAGVIVCGVHVFLWWILYFVYEMNRL